MGQQLAQYVVDWASIEQVKEVLLAESTLFTGELSLELSNANGQFSPEKKGSLLYGRALYNLLCELTFDGDTVFQGYLRDVPCDKANRTATFVMQNVLGKPAETILPPLTLSGVSPGAAIVEAIYACGLQQYVNVGSIMAASSGAIAAGATVGVNIAAGSNTSLLAFLQQLENISSISLFTKNGLITGKVFKPYPGNGASLKQPIGPAQMRDFTRREGAWQAYNNQVTMTWGSEQVWVSQDQADVGQTHNVRNYPLDVQSGSVVSVENQASAAYFSQLIVQRCSPMPVTFTCTAGKPFLDVQVGDRFPVTELTNWGFNKKAFELIESQIKAQEESISLTLRSV